jgi:hypothetical protein
LGLASAAGSLAAVVPESRADGSAIAEVSAPADLPLALARVGLGGSRPMLVVVGGADGLDPVIARRLLGLFRDRLAPVLERLGAVVIDGGTDAGVMAVVGQARRQSGAGFPLLGVAARGTVHLPGEPCGRGVPLEPNHTQLILVPGAEWGDEVPWIAAAASAAAGSRGSATLVAGGGRITERDIAASLSARRPTLLLMGSGGSADAAAAGPMRHPLLRPIAETDDWLALDALLPSLLGRGRAADVENGVGGT